MPSNENELRELKIKMKQLCKRIIAKRMDIQIDQDNLERMEKEYEKMNEEVAHEEEILNIYNESVVDEITGEK